MLGRDRTADWARSGVVALTGHQDGPPLVPPGHAATRAGQLAQRIGELTADTGHPVRLDGPRLLSERAAFTGNARRGPVSVGGTCRLLPSADGWVAVSCARPDDPMLFGALIGEQLPVDPWPAIAAWVRDHSGGELAGQAEQLGLAAGPVRSASPAPSAPQPLVPRPVEGLLVADFSALWAGPLCAHLLGLAGARVIKIETPQRPDGARSGDPEFYRLLHAGQCSVVLDPTEPGEQRALHALVEAADIVIESSRPRALAGFGLDADAAVAGGTSWVSITAHGRTSNRIGFGDDVAATTGLVAHGEDGDLLFCGDALADPLTGLTAAVLAMSAPANGSGVLWDVAMSDVVASTLDRTPDASTAARREEGRWVVDTSTGPVTVTEPMVRRTVGDAPGMGANTAEVLRELRIHTP